MIQASQISKRSESSERITPKTRTSTRPAVISEVADGRDAEERARLLERGHAPPAEDEDAEEHERGGHRERGDQVQRRASSR